MTRVRLRLVGVVDDPVMVPADTLTGLLRGLSDEVAARPDQGADPTNVGALGEMLRHVADIIDADCIALTTELVDVRQRSD